jgi:hypothetical protein
MENDKEIPSLESKVKAAQSAFPAAPPRAVQSCPLAQSPPVAEPVEAAPAKKAKPAPAKKPVPVEKKSAAPEKTWIKIKLIDVVGKPIPGERYRVKVPGGESVEGVLDEQGEAACWNLDPGTCKVTFPDLDEEAWEDA